MTRTPLRLPLVNALIGAVLLTSCAGDPRVRTEQTSFLDFHGPPRGELERSAVSVEDASLVELMALALSSSPRVRAARARAVSAAYGPKLAASLPDPMVTFGWYAEEVETRVGAQRWSLGIQQRLPWPGELSAGADRARFEERVAQAELDGVMQDVIRDVAITWHERAYLREARAVTGRVQEVMERFRAVALAEREAGSAKVAEVLRAESQLAQLEHDLIVIDELSEAEDERLRSLLALPQAEVLPASMAIAVPSLDALSRPQIQDAAQWNPDLRRARWRQQAAEAGMEVARNGWFPDLMLGGTYIATDRRRDLAPSASRPSGDGDDPLIVQLGLTLPMWGGRQNADVAAADARALAARMDEGALREHVRAELSAAWWRATSAERLSRLYADTLVPQAEAAAQAAQTLFDEGQGSFAGLLETIAAWHNFQLAQARAGADLGIAIAQLERWIGRPLERAVGQEAEVEPQPRSEEQPQEEQPHLPDESQGGER